MCDLIDLNSPKVKSLVNSKLASPLIPVPRNVESNEQFNSLVTEKRESLDNNPFDSVLYETTEYIRKKDDPFEIVLQRALKSKSKINTELKAQSVDFMDDFTPKCRRKNQQMMDKILNKSLIKGSESSIDEEKKERETSIVANNTNVACDSNAAENNKFISEQNNKIIDADPHELSILNQSAMNDTLLEASPKHKVDNEISIFLEKDPSFKKFVLPTSLNLKPHLNLQRTLSQEGRKSPRKLQYRDRRSQSTTDTLKKISQSDSTILLSLNKDLESKQSQQLLISNPSDIFSMTKLNSVSLLSNLSSVSSNGVMNTAFINSNCLSNERINTAENSMEIKSVQYDLSDLTERLNKLKCAIDRTTSTLRIKEEIDKFNSMKEKDNKLTINDKLIDIEVFIPESSCNGEHNKSTSSTTSSDSVFIDSGKINKSILNEAKALARTFEELSLKTDSGSNTDDLISNNILWVSELLPAYEDEIDNLIELPISPKENLKVDKSNDLKQFPVNVNNAKDDLMKEIKPQFTDNVSVRQTMVTTLLLDLKKLVKTENNSEVSKLIDNLENALGVKYKDNLELLANLNMSDRLHNSKMSDDKLDDIEQSDKANNDQKESKKVSSEEKICDDESSPPHISNGSENASQTTTVSSDNSLTQTSSCNNNSENHLNITKSPQAAPKDNHSDEKLAIELLVNLGKLLIGQTEDATTLQLLKSIGKTLNVATNNCKIKEESQTNDISCNTRRITAVGTVESERNESGFSSKKATYEQSFNSKPLKKAIRRSISTINSSSANTSNTSMNTKRRSISELKVQKHPALINMMGNKKILISGASNTKTVNTAELDAKNEKSLAIIDVKNKLKKKLGVVSSRGPIKAVHPVGTMQKKSNVTWEANCSIF
ncbi:serine-rich adhesin for platelets-like isoform X2 [Odontomachus brunneus]|uniref:serine-rich adhesin for platelets-like isoform X2 n=1 Tax=Odontomachus brunneus TaxID=486640 RepID=UPI0013F21428|nr:serine-rich adhesin for platelets-like isoform X2 [Odontomachus brunneus]